MKMLVKIKLTAAALALIAAALFSSCRTQIPIHPWTEYDVAGISIKVRPASRESLVKRFGNPVQVMNPYLDYPSLIQQRRLVVLEVAIESPDVEVELITKESTLVYVNPDSKIPTIFDPETSALDAKKLQAEWERYLLDSNPIQIPELVRKTRKGLPGNLLASPGKPAEGYLVFLRRFPKSGMAQLSLSLRSSNGDTGVIPMEIEIINPDEKTNTGIFETVGKKDKPKNTGMFDEETEDSAE